MKCDFFHNLITEYFDSGLTEEDKNLLFEHLSHCNECNNEFHSVQKTFTLLEKEKDTLIDSRKFYFDNLIGLEIVDYRKRKQSFFVKPIFGILTAVLAFTFTLYFMNLSNAKYNIIDKNTLLASEEFQNNENIISDIHHVSPLYEFYVTYLYEQIDLLDDIKSNNYFYDILNAIKYTYESIISESEFWLNGVTRLNDFDPDDINELITKMEMKKF